MARYIDADKIDFSPLEDDFDRARAKVIIMGQPTADVVEVKKVVEMLCKVKTTIIKSVSTMIEDDFNKIVKDALNERRDT